MDGFEDTTQNGASDILPEGLYTAETDPLTVDLDPQEFVDTADFLIEESRKFFRKQNLYERRQRNLDYYLGNVMYEGKSMAELRKSGKLSESQLAYIDNLVYEAEATLKPIALNQMPDLSVEPGSDSEESKKTATTITEIVNTEMKKRNTRTVLSRAYRHRPMFFIGGLKHRWDPMKGKNGDYVFEAIHPDNIDVDHTAVDNEVNNMRWVAHHYPLTVKEILMRFPKSKNELFAELGWDTKIEPGEKKLATQIKITEFWYTWYKKKKESSDMIMGGEDSKQKWEHINAVAWKYKKILFDNKKNPNWDWEGDEHSFVLDGDEKKEITPDMMREGMMTGVMPDIQTEKVYKNHLEKPEFPFIFIGYDQLGTQPMDVTTRIEQVQTLQDNVNVRGMQITSMAATAWGVDVFSTESGMTKSDIQKLDKTNPNMALLLNEDISKVYTRIPGVQASPELFKEQETSRERVFAKMGAHATTRGEREANETATGRQLLQDADYNKQDDETEETINYAAEKMANAALQYIKLRYTEEKLVRLKGPDGKTVFERLKGDMIEDGMEVTVSASAVDKRRRKQEALQRAEMQLTDPLSFYEDMGVANAKERTERLMWFTVDPKSYLSKYVMDVDPNDPQAMGTALNGDGGQQQLTNDLAMLTQGQMPQPPQPMTPEYIQGITQFLQTPDFANLDPQIQQVITQYAQSIAQSAGGM